MAKIEHQDIFEVTHSQISSGRDHSSLTMDRKEAVEMAIFLAEHPDCRGSASVVQMHTIGQDKTLFRDTSRQLTVYADRNGDLRMTGYLPMSRGIDHDWLQRVKL